MDRRLRSIALERPVGRVSGQYGQEPYCRRKGAVLRLGSGGVRSSFGREVIRRQDGGRVEGRKKKRELVFFDIYVVIYYYVLCVTCITLL